MCLLDAFAAPFPRTLRLSRDVTGPIRADQTTESRLRLTNTTKRHMNLDVRDAWPPSLDPSPVRQRVRLRPGTSERVSTVLAPTRRGTREADVVTIRSWGPLHLGARQVSLSAPLSLSVLPEFKARVLLPSRLPASTSLKEPHRRRCAAREPSSTPCAPTSWATIRATSTGARPPVRRN